MHTKGPWILDGENSSHVSSHEYHSIDAGDGFLKNGNGFCIQVCMSIDDARLIAAAPELLEALEGLYTLICDMQWSAPDNRYASITFAAAAIAKARGES